MDRPALRRQKDQPSRSGYAMGVKRERRLAEVSQITGQKASPINGNSNSIQQYA